MGELTHGFWTFLSETQILGVSLAEILGKLILLAVVSLIACVIERVLSRIVRRMLRHTRVPSVSFLINILKAVIWSLALMTVLEPVFGVQPTAFVAAIGVGSVALSLGLQDTVSNVIGGLALMTSKLIVPGDVISFAGFTGTVIDINWRSTCVADAYGQVNMIPNSVISKTALIKLSDATKNCCVLPLVARHGTDFEAARKEAIKMANERLGEWVDKNREVWITVISMDGGGIASQLSVPLMYGVSADHARTRLATGVSQMSWVLKP